MRRVAVISAGLALLVAAGCGGESGVSEGAVVSVYADAELCAGAGEALARVGREAGPVGVDLRCLRPVRLDGRLDLAQIGANARRATQDSAAVAYLLAPGREAARFASPILEAAGIPTIRTASGRAAMAEALAAIEVADPSSSLRDQVRDSLEAE